MKFYKVGLIVFFILLIDQILKVYIKLNMAIGDSIPMIGNWFYLHFVENEGMAWGWQFGGEYGKLFLSIFRLIAITGITYYLYTIVKNKYSKKLIVSMSLILAGAVGNMLDSAFYGLLFSHSDAFDIARFLPADGGYAGFLHGKVVDMFYFPIISGIWPDWVPIMGGKYFEFFRPVFNIADASISIGVVLLILFQKDLKPKKELTPVLVDEPENIP